MPKYFFDVVHGAKRCGISVRHFRRIAEESEVEHLVFYGKGPANGRFIWTADQIRQIQDFQRRHPHRKYFRGKRHE